MTIDELLVELGIRDLQLRKRGSDLILRGNNEALEPSFINELRTHKSALLGMMGSDSDVWWSPPITITPEMLPLVELREEEIERIVGGVPGGAANVQDIYPLAPLQEGILFHHLLGGEGDPYLLGMLFSFDSRERVESYVQALEAVIQRHDILRTGVMWEGLREPVQVVWRKAKLPVEEVEVEAGGGDAAEQLYARYNPRGYRIDVRQAPLVRVMIAEDKEQGRWLMMMLRHHLVGDHSTQEVMHREIEAYLLGEEEGLGEPLPFRNLVAEARLGVREEGHEEYFRKLLGEVEEPTAPYGLVEVRGDGRGIEEARVKVEGGLGRRIREEARKLGVSAASVCHVAWGVVLGKVSGREDVVFGSVLLGRMQGGEGADRVMGLFINTLPVRMRMGQGQGAMNGGKEEKGEQGERERKGKGEEGVEESVRGMQRQLAELLRHEHASLALAQRCSGVKAPLPLFTALLNYRHSGRGKQGKGVEGREGEARERAWEGIRILGGKERTNYPFVLSVDDLGEEFGLTAQVDARVNAKRVCGYMETALGSLVEALAERPGMGLSRLNVLPAGEREQLLYEWNETKREYESEQCVHELFEEQARKMPEAVAVVFEGEELSYGELNRRANQLAHYLRELGVKPDSRVALCAERSLEMIVGLLGILKAGGAYVPLDPGYPGERLSYMVEDSDPAVVLTQRHLREVFSGLNSTVPIVDMGEASAWQQQPESNIDCDSLGLTSRHLAYVIYTSGSTGKPKGVMVDHRAIARLVRNNGYASFAASDRIALASNPAFDASTMEIWGALLNGARIVVIEQAVLLEPREFGQALRQHGVNILWLTVGLFNNYADQLGAEFSQLRYLIVGGDALDPRVIARVISSNAPQHLLNGYGPTETTTFATTYEIRSWTEKGGRVPIGKPIGNTRIYILDGEGEPVPAGVAGEIYIGGAGVARGYLNREELTAERFVADPYATEAGARMYRTGDLGRWQADGNIEFLGRNDFQVKVRGFRIELGEIEARLAEYPNIREAVVIAREDVPGDKRLVAYYTSREAIEGAIDAEELQAHLSATLPEYMVPAAYVWMETLPLTPNGKLDRNALPAPESDAYAVRGYEAPVGAVETRLAEIWANLLKLDRVGRQDNFFSLGGHSLLVLKMVGLLEQADMKISVSDVYKYPTFESLASRITPSNMPASADEAILIRRSGTAPPLFLTPEGTGTLLYAHTLVSYIDEEISIYGLPSKATDEAQLETIEGMATRMVRMIRSVQPVGPYRIAGWSLGGILAYEIATQLIGANQEVDFLGLLDTHYFFHTDDAFTKDALHFDPKHQLLSAVQRKINKDQDEELKAKLEILKSNWSTMNFEALVEKCREMLLMPKQFSDATATQIHNWFARMHSHSVAYFYYSPQRIPIPVYLFRAQREADPFLAWDSVVPNDMLRIIPVSGNHHSMMESPNIEILGKTLSQAIHNATAVSAEQPDHRYSAIIPLQAGRPREKEPLFCIPGAGSGVSSFVDLTLCLDPQRPIYGLQPRGLEGIFVPHSTVSAASETYMRALEEIYPKGPIHLLGHSFGGWVAFDMAQRFLDAGRHIASLIILDSEVPDQKTEREYNRTDVLMEWLDLIEQIVDHPLDIGRSDLDMRSEIEQIEILHDLLVREGVMSNRLEPDALRGPLRVFGTSLRTRYQPKKPYPGPAQLVVADNPKLDENTNRLERERAAQGWKLWAPRIECLHASGSHMTMLKEPYVRSLVQLLRLAANGKAEPVDSPISASSAVPGD